MYIGPWDKCMNRWVYTHANICIVMNTLNCQTLIMIIYNACTKATTFTEKMHVIFYRAEIVWSEYESHNIRTSLNCCVDIISCISSAYTHDRHIGGVFKQLLLIIINCINYCQTIDTMHACIKYYITKAAL